MKRPGKAFVMSRRDDDGWIETQSGASDQQILCEAHEAKLGRVDDYAVRLLKAIKARLDAGATVIEVKNPEPVKLVGFAAAVVWRMAASRTDLAPERMLGSYAKRLEDLLFRDQSFDPLLLVSLNAYRLQGGDILNLGTLPYRYEELGRRFWRFIACGVIFDLKLDNRDAPEGLCPANCTAAAEAG